MEVQSSDTIPPMKIISVLNLKGGCGKTTIALNLAAALAEQGRRALVVDLDPQASALRWASQAPDTSGPGCHLRRDVVGRPVERGAARFKDKLLEAGKRLGAAVAVLDCPPELRDPALVAALLADVVLIPGTPSPLDLWAAEAAVATAREARKERGGRLPRISLIPSKLISGTVLAREIATTLEGLGEAVSPPIHQRVALVEATVAGQTIGGYAPGSPAHLEFQALATYCAEGLK